MRKYIYFHSILCNYTFYIFLILVVMPVSYDCGASSRVSYNRASLTSSNKQSKSRSDNNNNDYMHVSYYNSFMDNETIENLPDEQRLVYHSLKMYDPASRPVYNASKHVTIKFSFALIQICDMVM